MATTTPRTRSRGRTVLVAGAVALLGAGLGPAFLLALVAGPGGTGRCGALGGSGATAPISLLPAGSGVRVGATEYGGPGDPSSGTVGSSGVNLGAHPDSYAELGGLSFQTATAMGGLPYETPLRITWAGRPARSAIAYKRDIGLGGGPIDGLPRAIDLWWQLARALGIPYEDGRWSGPVRVQRPPAAGAGNVLGASAAVSDPMPVDAMSGPAGAAGVSGAAGTAGVSGAAGAAGASGAAGVSGPPSGCGSAGLVGGGSAPAPVIAGPRARLLSDGRAAAPAGAPAAVRGMIAAGDQIVGKPYLYGGGHGIPLDQIAPAYDCSSSVEHLLWGGGLLPAQYAADSTTLESFGAPGPGRWVTIYASAAHVFMYVAGLRWDTWNAAGPGDGSTGIGWHPLVRDANGFVARHPVGL